jgi:hypothetical protein
MVSGTASSRAGRGNRDPDASKQKDDVWLENIHMRTAGEEDPEVVSRLKNHHMLLKEADKYLDYVHHVETANRTRYERNLAELQMMDASGVTSSSEYG